MNGKTLYAGNAVNDSSWSMFYLISMTGHVVFIDILMKYCYVFQNEPVSLHCCAASKILSGIFTQEQGGKLRS